MPTGSISDLVIRIFIELYFILILLLHIFTIQITFISLTHTFGITNGLLSQTIDLNKLL